MVSSINSSEIRLQCLLLGSTVLSFLNLKSFFISLALVCADTSKSHHAVQTSFIKSIATLGRISVRYKNGSRALTSPGPMFVGFVQTGFGPSNKDVDASQDDNNNSNKNNNNSNNNKTRRRGAPLNLSVVINHVRL